MKVLITSGGTTEKIDDVRVLTNISSGALGAFIAREFLVNGHDEVDYICTKTSAIPAISACDEHGILNYHYVTDVASLMETMKELVPQVDIVIHAMAVSDFGFKRDSAIKLKSNDPESFIEHLRKTITVNPKVISHIKSWNPKCKLIGFKFEVGLSEEDLIKVAYNSLEKNNSDLVIANDLSEIKRVKYHKAYAIRPTGDYQELHGKEEIAEYIFNFASTP